ncbi:hypothetical protein [Nannocystis pusilla]|uniref:hypothetical protein n=1 Tax=Nannocystis pusilla TaxID=889268 RepID=UPI003B765903
MEGADDLELASVGQQQLALALHQVERQRRVGGEGDPTAVVGGHRREGGPLELDAEARVLHPAAAVVAREWMDHVLADVMVVPDGEHVAVGVAGEVVDVRGEAVVAGEAGDREAVVPRAVLHERRRERELVAR